MMSDEQVDQTASIMDEQTKMLDALFEIAMSSDEAETVRIAMSVLTGTEAGLNYLRVHPMIL